ncbi:MAG: efflux RND transporter permease subunit [Acidobacteriota bacterium]
MNLPLLSIRRPVFALMLILGLVVLGLVSLTRLNPDLNPDVDMPFITVSTVLPGASPETIETEITDILEEQINTIEGIRELSSTSSEGISQIFVEFELGYDVDVKAQQVREKIAPARAQLPLDIEDPVVAQLDPDASPIISVLVGGQVSVREISEIAQNQIKDQLERLPGVGSISLVGLREREVRIWLDPVRLAGYGLAIDDVRATLLQENSEMAGGRIEGSQREWTVTTSGKVRSVDDFGSLIAAERGGRLVYLRDVAVIEDGLAEERSIARYNGERGVSLDIRRRSGTNTVAVARAVRAEVERLQQTLPAGISISISRDMATFIESSIASVFQDMLLGGVLVVLVVLLFLRNPRSTFIAGLAIPSSVIASFTFFYMLGFTLNTMSLMALSLSIGVVIDDAIVVLEVIYRRIERGAGRREAAEEGSERVFLAVISTTLALCAVFVPIAFMQGSVGQWFYEFGLVMAIAVCVSSLFALTLTPMLASRMLAADQGQNRLSVALGNGLDRLDQSYGRVLEGAMRRKWVALSLAAAAIVGGCGVASTLPFEFFAAEDRGEFNVNIKMPIGTPLQVTDAVSRRVEALLREDPQVLKTFATVAGGSRQEANKATIFVQITSKQERTLTQEEFTGELRQRLDGLVTEAEEVTVSPIGWVSGEGFSAKAVTYSLQGPDLAALEGYADDLMRRMRDDPDFVDVGSSYESGKPEIEIGIDRDVAADLGVPATSIGRTIRTLLAGEEIGSFEDAGERYAVRVQVLPEFRDTPEKLHLINVRSVSGQLVPITNVALLEMGSGAVQIERQNRQRQISIGANNPPGVTLGQMAAKIEAWGEEMGIEAPAALVASAQAREMQETGAALIFAFVLSLVSIYMVLASLFNSLIHPFTIMASAPLSFIGAFLALKVSGRPLDMLGGIGLLVLMGLVMKNGILLIDYVNQLRRDGMGREEAILAAGPARLRPVLMTAASLVLGLLPTALSNSQGAEFRAPIAVLTIGGMITSTLLKLVVVPVLYDLVDRFIERSTALLRHLLRPRRARDAAASGS